MSFFDDLGIGQVDDVVRGITGQTAAEASTESAQLQADVAREQAALFEPFRRLGLTGIDMAGFLTDPQAQFDFIQSNPLFNLALENANTATMNMAAARGRLSAGDTLQQLSNNVLLSATPLINSQKQSIFDLLKVGTGASGSIGDYNTSAAAAEAGGIVGSANARTQGASNIIQGGLTAAGLMNPTMLAGGQPGYNWGAPSY